jgi:hypothetical protein
MARQPQLLGRVHRRQAVPISGEGRRSDPRTTLRRPRDRNERPLELDRIGPSTGADQLFCRALAEAPRRQNSRVGGAAELVVKALKAMSIDLAGAAHDLTGSA